MRVTPEEGVERLELVARHAVAGAGQPSRRRRGSTGSMGIRRREPLVLINERSWWPRLEGEAACDKRGHRVRSGRRTDLDIGVDDALNRLGIGL